MPDKKKLDGLERLIENDFLELKDIGEIYDVSHETVRNRLKERNLYKKYKKYRSSEYRKSIYEKLTQSLNSLALKKAEGNKPAERALEYRLTHNRKAIRNYEKLQTLFNEYYQAKERGEKKSTQELGDLVGINQNTALKIIKEVDEEPLNKKTKLSKSEREITEKAIETETDLNFKDMEYLTGIPWYNFSYYAENKNEDREHDLIFDNLYDKITYRKTMDLFEALEADFTKEEAKEYAEIETEEGYQFIMENKERVISEVNKFLEEVGLNEKQI